VIILAFANRRAIGVSAPEVAFAATAGEGSKMKSSGHLATHSAILVHGEVVVMMVEMIL